MTLWERFFNTIQSLDETVHRALQPLPEQTLFFWQALTHLGDFITLFSIATLVSLWLWRRRKRPFLAAWLFSGYFFGQVLTTVIKHWVERPRPLPYVITHHSQWSFPSGHTSGSWTLALLLAIAWSHLLPPSRNRTTLQGIGILLAAAISLSRIFLGVHWTSDVVGGVIIALLWTTLWSYCHPERKRRIS